MIRILMCTFNGAAYVREQIDSILCQDTTEPFELWISDDGSSDATLTILREMEQQYPDRIRVSVENPPTGSACRHFLTLFSEGAAEHADYLMFSDQDDVWKPSKIRKSLAAMHAVEAVYQNSTPVLVHCDSEIVDKELHPVADSFVKYQKMTPSRCGFHQLLVQNNVVGGAMMINHALAERLVDIPEHAVMHDQWIALVAAAFGQIRFIPEALYLYRQHGDNVLGADRGSRIGEILGRFGIGRKDGRSKADMDAHSHAVYHELFLQAESFNKIYGAQLTKRQQRELAAFLRIPEEHRIVKILTIFRYGFTYNLLHRTIGECLFIG
jgi:glycosyltransferase involved in cell wall biosynthesis